MIGRTWQFRRFDEVLLFMGTGAAPPPPASEALTPRVATSLLTTWLLGAHGSSRSCLDEIAAALGRPAQRAAPLHTNGPGLGGAAEQIVHQALLTGALRAYRMRQGYGRLSPRITEVEAAPIEGKKHVQTTWIALYVVDDRDPRRPAAFLPYSVELPDGSLREGTLDKEGKARLEGVPPGRCLVSFPTVDANDWKPL